LSLLTKATQIKKRRQKTAKERESSQALNNLIITSLIKAPGENRDQEKYQRNSCSVL